LSFLQGDGTAFILQSNQDIFTFSVHCEKNFPVRKQTSDLDVGLACGMENKEYIDTVRMHLAWLLDQYRPGIVLYDAGVDPHKDDVLGRLNLTDKGTYSYSYHWLLRTDAAVLECLRIEGIVWHV